MTPKEKAIDLFCKMYGCEINTDLKNIYIINGDGYFIAKDCAIIAVDEILKNINVDNPLEEGKMNFWLDVRLEIENL